MRHEERVVVVAEAAGRGGSCRRAGKGQQEVREEKEGSRTGRVVAWVGYEQGHRKG